MRVKNQRDFVAGLMFTVVGVAFAWGATNYNIGEGARMGPGYFPLLVGTLLAILGLIVAFEGLVVETEDGGKIGAIAWKPLFFIIAGNVVFGIALGGLPAIGVPAMGLIVGIYALTIVAAMAGDEFKWKEVLILGTILAIGSYFAFVYMLNLQFPVWPSFIVR
ncbi:tripartite tricarboxylate transporter TctB family protein [Ramlibacter rhizophilus]|uniref:Tripartite tricarboxylate transporter TctB family protein n=2 Tax=Ramlibacter rhizophilus TaxID=1781167 RepID=A0A4Z0BPZ5_9BURK|nr:tripartite tricarboxylate transporter TctB family protein [Ramlibacter rhizophilus]TFZ01396.1 tripartite tricarboxylate transporter TctB family protein [Ramlibacter rhizophilus]